MDYQLSGRAAIVTGVSKGIGKAVAGAVCANEINVLSIAKDEYVLEDVEQIVCDDRSCQGLVGDVSNPDLTDRVLPRCEKIFGGVDILVNNAGGPLIGGCWNTI